MVWQAQRESITACVEGAANVVLIKKVMRLTYIRTFGEHMRRECDAQA